MTGGRGTVVDNDTWDIVSSVGYTALLVAGWRALHASAEIRWCETTTRGISSQPPGTVF